MKLCVLRWLFILICATPRMLVAQGNSSLITVAQDGSGQYRSVQAALDAIPLGNKKRITIYIRNGIYYEKLHLDSSKNFVSIRGEDKFNTILTYNDHTGKISAQGDTINTYTSESILVRADDFCANNITFQNDAGFGAGQAVAVRVAGDRSSFINCRFIGNQDVLFPSKTGTRQYFERCYIEGTTDFIFGPSTAWFEQCHIHSNKNSQITAASTPETIAFGYVFNDCVLTADTGLLKVSLGRPWRPYACVAYIHCYIGRHIMPQGWANWNNTEHYKTARYTEYKNYGPGASTAERLSWTHQLSDEAAKNYTIKKVLEGWDPKR